LGRLGDKSFYDGEKFSDGTYLFFDATLKHPDKSHTLGRKRFFAEQQLQH
jgi:hypothetical protein